MDDDVDGNGSPMKPLILFDGHEAVITTTATTTLPISSSTIAAALSATLSTVTSSAIPSLIASSTSPSSTQQQLYNATSTIHSQPSIHSNDSKTLGIVLALISSILIGTSFIFTKKGLIDATRRSGQVAGEHVMYLHNAKWWLGMITMILGEIANFAAYSYSPAILVTPLGAGSVLVSAVLANFFLDEQLQKNGILGCVLGVIGSVVIILNSPEERAVESVDDILFYALQPLFVFYVLAITAFSLYLMYFVAPQYGKTNLLVYVTICSLIGSISVMAVKGFAIALKLTFSGSNQLTRPSTYVFGITVAVCAITQMNFLNKALELFSTNIVTPVYYVFFTSATILASVILFQGFNDASGAQVASVFCGFVTIFIGVYLLNTGRSTHSRPGSPCKKQSSSLGLGGGVGGGGGAGDESEGDQEPLRAGCSSSSSGRAGRGGRLVLGSASGNGHGVAIGHPQSSFEMDRDEDDDEAFV